MTVKRQYHLRCAMSRTLQRMWKRRFMLFAYTLVNFSVYVILIGVLIGLHYFLKKEDHLISILKC